MLEAKGNDCLRVDRESEAWSPAPESARPVELDDLLRDIDDLLGQIAARSAFDAEDNPSLPGVALRAV
jgi:hypothetical protein